MEQAAEQRLLLRWARWRYRAGLLIRIVTLGVGALFVATLVYMLVMLLVSLPDLIHDYFALQRGELGIIDAAFASLGLQLAFWLPVSLYLAMYVLPFVLTLPVSAPIIGLWRAPPRFLFLRPFNRGRLSRPLARIARRDVSPFGHIYTLSDADIKVPWYVRIPLLFGQLALFSFRVRKMRSAAQVKALGRAAERTWLRNINWCMALGKIFPVASTDACWRQSVECLLGRSTAVIVDVSDLRENVMWEINRAKAQVTERQMLFLLSSDTDPTARQKVIECLGQAAVSDRLFEYQAQGLVEADAFQTALAEIISGGSDVAKPPGPDSIAATVLFVVGLLPVLGLAFPAFGESCGLPRWSPWEHSAHWPGLANVINPGALITVAYGILCWLLLLVASRHTATMRFLTVIQTLILLAAPIGMLDW